MTIYNRTALGSEALSGKLTDLPRRTRALLMAIDGRTDSAAFERSLSSFGDVPALLDSLRLSGYIEESGSEGVQDRGKKRSGLAPPSRPRSEDVDSALQQTSEQRGFRRASPIYQPASGAAFARGGDERARLANAQLKTAVSLMSDFVSEHLPAQALEIVIELERLSSVEALARSLRGYEQLIRPAGMEKAQRHLRELRSVLSGL